MLGHLEGMLANIGPLGQLIENLEHELGLCSSVFQAALEVIRAAAIL